MHMETEWESFPEKALGSGLVAEYVLYYVLVSVTRPTHGDVQQKMIARV